MQAIREKMDDVHAMQKAKAELKEEGKAEKGRVKVVHKIRLAKEAKAGLVLHANKAKEKLAAYDNDHDLHPIAYLQP